MADGGRKHDIVVFGASGFTGVRVAEYLVRRLHNQPISLAVSARSQAKVAALLAPRLRKITEFTAAMPPFMRADVDDEASIVAMCAAARVVINCVGPFRLYGDVVVRSCVATGTDYVDVTGEPYFIDACHLKYHDQAKAKNLLIVPACGFDSVPADLGVVFATQQFKAPQVAATVEEFLTLHAGAHGLAMNTGTYETLLESLAGINDLDVLRKQLRRPKPEYTGKPLKRITRPYFDKRVQRWAMPFPGSDAAVVRNSQSHLMEANDPSQPKPVQFAAYCYFSSFFFLMIAVVVGAIVAALSKISFLRPILKRYPDLFTLGIAKAKGPSEQQISEASFTMTFFSKGYSSPPASKQQRPDLEVITTVTGPEVGYVTTVICIGEAAVTIIDEKDKLPQRGVLSPAAAFRTSSYIDRLQRGGVHFSVVSTKVL